MAFVEIEPDVSLYYTEIGQGQNVLYLHGVLGSSQYFFPQQNDPIVGLHSVFIDFRGHGQSSDPKRGHSVSQYALDVARVIDGLDLSPVVLIGWSMGALVACEYLSIFGTAKIRGLVVVDQSPSDFAYPGWPYGTITVPNLRKIQERILHNPKQQASDNASAIFHQPTALQTTTAMAEFLRVRSNTAYSIFTDQTFRDYRQKITEFDVPVQLCFGQDPAVVSPEAGVFMAKTLAKAQLALFDQSSHCPFWEEPDRFAEVLTAFVASL